MSKYSTILIIIAVILISIAFFNASTIPVQANGDLVRAFSMKASGKQRAHRLLNFDTKERQDLYIQTQSQRRLLQNIYVGASGLICLFAGLIVLPMKANQPK